MEYKVPLRGFLLLVRTPGRDGMLVRIHFMYVSTVVERDGALGLNGC